MRRDLTFSEAVFVAALPYRKSVFRSGGFAQTEGPAAPLEFGGDAVAWRKFLARHFNGRDLARAESEAAGYAHIEGPVWRSTELEDRVGCGAVSFVSVWDADYPRALRFCYDPPPVLFYSLPDCAVAARPADAAEDAAGDAAGDARAYSAARGSVAQWIGSAATAIVGTRQAHPLAEAAVREYVATIARSSFRAAPTAAATARDAFPFGDRTAQGVNEEGIRKSAGGPPIVSGLALGVDRIAHEAAIANGLPCIAVLGAGLLHAGPRANLDLVSRARDQGIPFVLASEFPPHIPARAAHFPRRNRVIAGLVERVAVLQAPLRSGAMITARFALEEGRDVFVFDHEALREASGSNDGARSLLDAGATLIALPELEARLRKEPPFAPEHRAARLKLWKAAALGNRVRWLGGRYYLDAG